MPRRPSRSRPIAAGDLLQRTLRGDTLAAVQLGAEGAEALRQRLQSQLPAELQAHVAAVIAKPGEIVVFADAATWAARLKLALAESPPDLSPAAAAGSPVKVRVMPTGSLRR
ncbi:MAG: hypothetical protein RLZZ200_2714 [Pseudomonadota bacterium]|jgi:hypothetical protein